MLIGIDGNEANIDKKVGISEFAYQLLLQFSQFQISNIKYQIYLKTVPNDDLPQENENWKYRIVKPSKLWTQFGLPFDLYVNKSRPDIFFSLTHYAPRFSPVPTVISIMDLAFINFSETFKKSDLYQLRSWTSYSVRNAKKVITISQSSKDDIINEYGIEAERVVVVYPGIKLKTPSIAKALVGKQNSKLKNTAQMSNILKDKYKIQDDFILFVGTLQPRKNLVRLIEAFSKAVSDKKHSGLQLIIIGKKGWLYEEILAAPEKYDVQGKVQFLEFVPDNDLSIFYSQAKCFVLPSLYEGFGLPVLEAMQFGCPVITSNISSLPEAGGEAAKYFDPTNVDDIADKIVEVVESSEKRDKMIKKGHDQVKKFSWEKSAKKVLEVLEEVGRSDD